MNLDHVPILDHHCHALLREDVWHMEPFNAHFTEAYDPVILEQFVPDNVYYRRSLRDLATYYGCEATREAVLEARAAGDYRERSRAMFRDANITSLLIDDGIWVDRLMTVQACAAFLDLPAQRVLRLEAELASFMAEHDSFSGVLAAFETMLRREAPTLAGLKSIIAYRTGLEVAHHDSGVLEREFAALKHNLEPGTKPRISSKPLLDAALWVGLRVASETGLPVQFHTGYGDPDLDLRLANPLHLRPIFEAKDLRVNIVMLHCYPFVREAGYLASVYPGAYLDLGLTIPYTSTHAMRSSVLEALHLAPITKILFSTDAQRTPELFWLAVRHGRRVIGQALEMMVADDDLTAPEAAWTAERILNGNARSLYPRK